MNYHYFCRYNHPFGNMKDYIKLGIEQNLISFNGDMSRITYVSQKKERNYNNPEEKVQAETFLRLILDYNYPVKQIKQFVPVTMGREIKEADIVVYEIGRAHV